MKRSIKLHKLVVLQERLKLLGLHDEAIGRSDWWQSIFVLLHDPELTADLPELTRQFETALPVTGARNLLLGDESPDYEVLGKVLQMHGLF